MRHSDCLIVHAHAQPPSLPKGLGVGLSLSRVYARLHGGDVHLSSVPGIGAHANVVLQRAGGKL